MKKILSRFLPVVLAIALFAPAYSASAHTVGSTIGFTATALSSSSVTLTWTSTSTTSSSLAQHDLYIWRCSGTGCTPDTSGTPIFEQISNFLPIYPTGSHIDTGLTPSSIYRYTVREHHGGAATSGTSATTGDVIIPPAENTLILCSDGIDNDGDTLIDLDDPDCASFIPHLTLIKTVTNDNGGIATTASFQGKIDGSNVTWDSAQIVSVGSHTASETNLTGYSAGTWGGDCNPDGTITLALGQNKTCTITNNDIQPKLTVTKIVTNDNGGTKVISDFPLFVNATGVTSGVQNGFNVGSYTISETSSAGYTSAISGDCSANGSITLAVGDVKSCTITNNDIQPTITLVKHVVNDNGGSASVSDFPLSVNGTSVSSGDATGFNAGSYTASEVSNPAAYTASGWSGNCAADGSFTLSVGENKTCEITNNDKPANLTVIKHVNNNFGGLKEAIDFIMNVIGGNVSSTSFNGSETGVTVTLDAGSYNADEVSSTGYQKTLGEDCSGDIANGESKTCTITNDDIAPKLTVTKTVENTHGGTMVVSDFPLYVDGTSVTSGEQNTYSVGTYNVTEDNQSGYYGVFGGDCNVDGNVSLALGDVKNCTLTNYDTAPGLTLHKGVTNDNGGLATQDNFQAYINGSPVSWDSTQALDAGTYTLSEDGATGYQGSEWSCDGGTQDGDTITLEVGDSINCSVNNNDIAPTVTLTKVVNNNYGGTKGPDDFGLSIGGTAVNSGQTLTVNANVPIEIMELSLTGYSFVSIGGDDGCPSEIGGTVTLSEGQNISCTITNEDVAPKLTVTKVIHNTHGGLLEVSDVPLFVNGDQVTSGEENLYSAGVYTVSETNPTGYVGVISGDCDAEGKITLAIGDVKSCTITNSDLAPGLTVIKNVVGGTKLPSDFQIHVTTGQLQDVDGSPQPGSAIGTSYSNLSAGEYTIYETGPENYIGSISGDCDSNGVVTLSLGGTKSCTITNTFFLLGCTDPRATNYNSSATQDDESCTYPVIENDICPNIDGLQTEVPTGRHLNGRGECVHNTSVGGSLPPKTQGEVLGASTICDVDFAYLRKGYVKNDITKVEALQKFLMDYLKVNIAVDGKFGPITENFVKKFQETPPHNQKILAPWGLTKGTGIFYLTSLNEAKNVMCPDLQLPVPATLIPWSKNPNLR